VFEYGEDFCILDFGFILKVNMIFAMSKILKNTQRRASHCTSARIVTGI